MRRPHYTPHWRASQAYERSSKACAHGSDGLIVTFKDTPAEMAFGARGLPDGGRVDRRFKRVPAVAAHVSNTTLKELFNDMAVKAVEADCIIKLEEPVPEAAKEPTFTTATIPWGIDRIDSRSGQDGEYIHGGATGAGTRTYVLDTGVRISHVDLAGRRSEEGGCVLVVVDLRAVDDANHIAAAHDAVGRAAGEHR